MPSSAFLSVVSGWTTATNSRGVASASVATRSTSSAPTQPRSRSPSHTATQSVPSAAMTARASWGRRRRGHHRTVAERDLGHGHQRQALDAAVVTEEVGHERVGRLAQQVLGGSHLLEHAADVQDGDAVGQLDRLVDVVGDEHDRLVHPALQVEQLVLQPGAHDRVDRGVGLVHEQHGWIGRQGAGDADPLLLPAGQRSRVAAEQARLEVEQRGQLVDPGADAVLGPAEELGDRGDVVADLAVREQTRLLDHVADPPPQLVERQGADVGALEPHGPARRLDEAVDHLQRRGLAAARRPDESDELAPRDREVETSDRRTGGAGIDLGQIFEPDGDAGRRRVDGAPTDPPRPTRRGDRPRCGRATARPRQGRRSKPTPTAHSRALDSPFRVVGSRAHHEPLPAGAAPGLPSGRSGGPGS